jgi:hypothetical protein
MTDTPEHIRKLQADFFKKKSVDERFKIGLDMTEDGRRMVEGALRQQHPEWSAAELKVGVFKRMYRPDFTPEKLDEIAQSYLASQQS